MRESILVSSSSSMAESYSRWHASPEECREGVYIEAFLIRRETQSLVSCYRAEEDLVRTVADLKILILERTKRVSKTTQCREMRTRGEMIGALTPFRRAYEVARRLSPE